MRPVVPARRGARCWHDRRTAPGPLPRRSDAPRPCRIRPSRKAPKAPSCCPSQRASSPGPGWAPWPSSAGSCGIPESRPGPPGACPSACALGRGYPSRRASGPALLGSASALCSARRRRRPIVVRKGPGRSARKPRRCARDGAGTVRVRCAARPRPPAAVLVPKPPVAPAPSGRVLGRFDRSVGRRRF